MDAAKKPRRRNLPGIVSELYPVQCRLRISVQRGSCCLECTVNYRHPMPKQPQPHATPQLVLAPQKKPPLLAPMGVSDSSRTSISSISTSFILNSMFRISFRQIYHSTNLYEWHKCIISSKDSIVNTGTENAPEFVESVYVFVVLLLDLYKHH